MTTPPAPPPPNPSALPPPPPRMLVTGGAGFIGGHLVRRLLHHGYRVRVLDNFSQQDTVSALLPEHASHLEILRGDVTHADACARAVGAPGEVAGVFHLAAMSKVLPSLGDVGMVGYCAEQNVLGTVRLLEAVARAKGADGRAARVVYAASSTAYGDGDGDSDRNGDKDGDRPQSEADAVRPGTPYALSKQFGEEYCALMSRMHGVPTVRLRFFMVYGPREPSAGAYAIVTGVFARARAEGRPLTIHGDGLQSRDFVHVTDVADACLRAMERDGLTDATINVGTGVSTTILELARAVEPDAARRVHGPARAFDLRRTLCDTTRMAAALRFRPRRHLRAGCAPSAAFPAPGSPSPSDADAPPSVQVVVCRFREDVEWTARWLEQRVLYNKGADDLDAPAVRLDNVGRDSDCYLRHILRFYPRFPDVTVFLQGSVRDHADPRALEDRVDRLVSGADRLGAAGYAGLSSSWGEVRGRPLVDARHAALPLQRVWDAVFGPERRPAGDRFRCNYNGLFAVSRERLLRHGRHVYETLLRLQRELDPVGYVNERLWTPLFDDASLESLPAPSAAAAAADAEGADEGA